MNRKSALAFAAALAALATLGSTAAQANTITFDDLPDNSQIQNGYASLNWNNFYVLNGNDLSPSGYQNGIVSQNNVAYNALGEPASFSSATPFTLNNLYLTAAWNDGLTIAITGIRNGSVVDSYSGTFNTSGPTDVILNWANIDEVDFASSGGVNHGYNGGGTHFALDNVGLNAAVPEPATWAMLILGIGMIGIAARRRSEGATLAA